MDRFTYLKACFDHRAYACKEWLLSVVAIGFEDEESKAILSPVPYAVWIEDNKFYFNDHNNERQTLEHDIYEPVFRMADHFDLPADFHPFLDNKATRTTFGILLFNVVMFYETIGMVIPYMNSELQPGKIRKEIARVAVNDPLPGETVPEGKAPMADILQINRNINYLEGILGAIVKCGSKDALTVSKEVIALKDKLLKENKDRLSDPVVFNDIVEQCVNLDYELQMKGESATFYIAKDYVTNCRKRMFIMFGMEYNSETNEWVPMVDPLTSGWNPTLMSNYINTAVEAAYNRGKATGEGGARVKDILRIIASTQVTEEDCGSLVGEDITLYKHNKGMWLGSFIIINGKTAMLGPDYYDKNEGKVVKMRAPHLCLTPDGHLCKVCCGSGLGESGTRLGSETSGVASVFMNIRMKMSHVSGTSNGTINWESAFS